MSATIIPFPGGYQTKKLVGGAMKLRDARRIAKAPAQLCLSCLAQPLVDELHAALKLIHQENTKLRQQIRTLRAQTKQP